MILLIDNYDSFTYNLFQYFEELGASCRVVRNDKINLDQIKKLKPSGIVLSPGPGNPDSSGVCLDILKELSIVTPILGVCLGHQAIGQVFGGKVIRAKTFMHGKTSMISHNEKGIFKGVSQPFQAARYHSLIVERSSLPRCLEITAQITEEDANEVPVNKKRREAPLIMGLRHRSRPVHGVQFHPESVMTGEGKKLLTNFLNLL